MSTHASRTDLPVFEVPAREAPPVTSMLAVALLSATVIVAAIGTTTVLAVEHVEHPELTYFPHA